MRFKIISKFRDKKSDSLGNTRENSAEHMAYLAGLRREKLTVRIIQFAILIGIILLWEIGAEMGFIDSFIMSQPSSILETGWQLAQNELLMHIGVTLGETVAGFLISMGIGLVIAILLWASEMAQKIFQPYLVVLNALPKIALGPILIIWVGTGVKAIIAMVILICVVITTITLLHGFCDVDKDMIFLVQSMGGSKFTVFRKLILPSTVPLIISTVKINVGLAFVGAIMGEYLVSRAGLGYLIVYGSQVFNLDLVMTSTIILLGLAGGMYAVVAIIEKKLVAKR